MLDAIIPVPCPYCGRFTHKMIKRDGKITPYCIDCDAPVFQCETAIGQGFFSVTNFMKEAPGQVFL